MIHATRVRYGTAAVLTVVACLLYLDRYAVGIAAERMRVDLQMTQTQMSWFLSAFFWSYALSQVPAGWLSDRWGPRAGLAHDPDDPVRDRGAVPRCGSGGSP